jgi:hypothetical protein
VQVVLVKHLELLPVALLGGPRILTPLVLLQQVVEVVVVTELLEQVVVVEQKCVVLAAAMAEQAALLDHHILFKVVAEAEQVVIAGLAALADIMLLQLVAEAQRLDQVVEEVAVALDHRVAQVAVALASWVKAVLVPKVQNMNLVAAQLGAMAAVVVAAVVVLDALVIHV